MLYKALALACLVLGAVAKVRPTPAARPPQLRARLPSAPCAPGLRAMDYGNASALGCGWRCGLVASADGIPLT